MNSFISIGRVWGEVLEVYSRNESFEYAYMLVATSKRNMNVRSVMVKNGEHQYEVLTKEVQKVEEGWTPSIDMDEEGKDALETEKPGNPITAEETENPVPETEDREEENTGIGNQEELEKVVQGNNNGVENESDVQELNNTRKDDGETDNIGSREEEDEVAETNLQHNAEQSHIDKDGIVGSSGNNAIQGNDDRMDEVDHMMKDRVDEDHNHSINHIFEDNTMTEEDEEDECLDSEVEEQNNAKDDDSDLSLSFIVPETQRTFGDPDVPTNKEFLTPSMQNFSEENEGEDGGQDTMVDGGQDELIDSDQMINETENRRDNGTAGVESSKKAQTGQVTRKRGRPRKRMQPDELRKLQSLECTDDEAEKGWEVGCAVGMSCKDKEQVLQALRRSHRKSKERVSM